MRILEKYLEIQDDLLKGLLKENQVNYEVVLDKSYKRIIETYEAPDLTMIIPVRGREAFLARLLDSFENCRVSNLLINFIVVEHSNSIVHLDLCYDRGISYVHIPCKEGEYFNKCLAVNVGALLARKSKYIMIHDLDCLVQSAFFLNLFANIEKKSSKAIQCFTNRRVLYCDEDLTKKLLENSVSLDSLTVKSKGIRQGHNNTEHEICPPELVGIAGSGAPGGSVLIDYDLFFEVGGLDPELFAGNAPEDTFFWDKITMFDDFHICDNPANEIFHLHHEVDRSVERKEFLDKIVEFYKYYEKLGEDRKINYIAYKEKLLRKYRKHE